MKARRFIFSQRAAVAASLCFIGFGVFGQQPKDTGAGAVKPQKIQNKDGSITTIEPYGNGGTKATTVNAAGKPVDVVYKQVDSAFGEGGTRTYIRTFKNPGDSKTVPDLTVAEYRDKSGTIRHLEKADLTTQLNYSFDYREDGKLVTASTYREVNGQRQVVQSENIIYDAQGNILTQTIAHPGASDPTGQPEQIKITRTTDQPAPKVERYNSGTQSWEPAGNNDWVKLVNTIRSEEKDTTAITGKAAEHAGNIEDDLQAVREAAAAHPMEMNDDHIPPPPDPFKPRAEPEGPFSKPGGEGTAAPLAKKPEREGLAPPSNPFSFDPCILGTWEATSFRETAAIPITGGTGFRVTFTKDDDGLIETIDYANMQPMRAGNDKDTYTYKGSATARISARDGVAKLEKMQTTGVTWHYRDVKPMKFPDLGPGGLGGTSDSNSYVCTADSLEYHTSTHRDKHANCTVKLTRVK